MSHKIRGSHIFNLGLLMALILQSSNATEDSSVYSHGYRAGILVKFSTKGWPESNKHGAGQLLMGRDSTIWEECSTLKNADGVMTEICETRNPWTFTAPIWMQTAAEEAGGMPVVIEYDQKKPFTYNPFKSENDYFALNIKPIEPTFAPKTACINTHAKGNFSKGFRIGRIVKASQQGFFQSTLSWELIFQVGDAGNEFIEMSTTDRAIFDCAVAWLKSGKKIRLDYDQKLLNINLHQKTDYDIAGIRSASGGWAD